jgi:uncharacterized protein (TIGR03086 family)
MAGGMEFPAEVVAVVAIEELVVHGWDLARATGRELDPDAADLAVAVGFLEQLAGGGPSGAFGAPVPTDDSAPALDRAVGLSGRDPGWSPPA